MKVKELIKQLQLYDPELTVGIHRPYYTDEENPEFKVDFCSLFGVRIEIKNNYGNKDKLSFIDGRYVLELFN